MIAYRNVRWRDPFLWESAEQAPGRWHGAGEGPAHYFADTPQGAWAELIRHEEITEEADLAGVRRAMWAVDIGDPPVARPEVEDQVVRGGPSTYGACREEAARLRDAGEPGLVAPSAALAPGAAHGWTVSVGLRPTPPANGRTIVLFGPRPDLVGRPVVTDGVPSADVLSVTLPLR